MISRDICLPVFLPLQHSSFLEWGKAVRVGALDSERKLGTFDWLVLLLRGTHLLEVGF